MKKFPLLLGLLGFGIVVGWYFLKPIEKVIPRVDMQISPAYDFKFDTMRVGALQHIDREYTYDVIPEELKEGMLFQGIHRQPAGTSISFKVNKTGTAYFFFHIRKHGGYNQIFETLPGWELCESAPQYDIHNGPHGLEMLMYKQQVTAGTYSIPKSTEDLGCFNMVFQFED